MRITKGFLRKSINKLFLRSSQLQTVLSEVEVFVNTRPFAYADNKLKPRKIITPMNFLSMNQKDGLPATVNNHEDDPDYKINNLSSSEKFLEIWKEGQIHLKEFREICENNYLLNSRERNQI